MFVLVALGPQFLEAPRVLAWLTLGLRWPRRFEIMKALEAFLRHKRARSLLADGFDQLASAGHCRHQRGGFVVSDFLFAGVIVSGSRLLDRVNVADPAFTVEGDGCPILERQ